MKFALLLEDVGIDPTDVAIVLHSPKEPALKRVMPWLVVNEPDIFAAYQNNHPGNEEATLMRRKYLASFLLGPDGDFIFCGIFEIGTGARWTAADFEASGPFGALTTYAGHKRLADWGDIARLDGRRVFDLTPTDRLQDLIGRLTIQNPKTRAYVRLAENFDPDITSIARENLLVTGPPSWTDFIVTGVQMRVLPQSWAVRLREWRGIYLIVDEVDGARYVGSAYGEQNLFGRWIQHVAQDFGVTVGLAGRDPANFRFSILQRLNPDMEPREVVSIENSWKIRLHTHDFGLNEN